MNSTSDLLESPDMDIFTLFGGLRLEMSLIGAYHKYFDGIAGEEGKLSYINARFPSIGTFDKMIDFCVGSRSHLGRIVVDRVTFNPDHTQSAQISCMTLMPLTSTDSVNN